MEFSVITIAIRRDRLITDMVVMVVVAAVVVILQIYLLVIFDEVINPIIIQMIGDRPRITGEITIEDHRQIPSASFLGCYMLIACLVHEYAWMEALSIIAACNK